VKKCVLFNHNFADTETAGVRMNMMPKVGLTLIAKCHRIRCIDLGGNIDNASEHVTRG
jgi:hypothetical protein